MKVIQATRHINGPRSGGTVYAINLWTVFIDRQGAVTVEGEGSTPDLEALIEAIVKDERDHAGPQ